MSLFFSYRLLSSFFRCKSTKIAGAETFFSHGRTSKAVQSSLCYSEASELVIGVASSQNVLGRLQYQLH